MLTLPVATIGNNYSQRYSVKKVGRGLHIYHEYRKFPTTTMLSTTKQLVPDDLKTLLLAQVELVFHFKKNFEASTSIAVNLIQTR